MIWSQNYAVSSFDRLLEMLTGATPTSLLLKELECQGLKVKKIDTIVLDDDDYAGKITGLKVTLSNGAVWVHKLVKQYTANGDYGCDYYEWREEKEKVKVVHESDGEV